MFAVLPQECETHESKHESHDGNEIGECVEFCLGQSLTFFEFLETLTKRPLANGAISLALVTGWNCDHLHCCTGLRTGFNIRPFSGQTSIPQKDLTKILLLPRTSNSRESITPDSAAGK